jgi:hypothetical protein
MADTQSRSGLFKKLRCLAGVSLALAGCGTSPKAEAIAPSVDVGLPGGGGNSGGAPDGSTTTNDAASPVGTGGISGDGAAPGSSTPDPDEPNPPADAGMPTPVMDAALPVDMARPPDVAPMEVAPVIDTAPVIQGCANGHPPPMTLLDWGLGHPAGTTLGRGFFDDHIAIYNDNDIDAEATAWLPSFISKAFQYVKTTYDPTAKFGGNCLYVFLHESRPHATSANYFDGFSGFRNSLDFGKTGWSQQVYRDVLLHQLALVVEGANNGIHESPAFAVWGNSKWAEFFNYDLLVALGMTNEATAAYDKFITTSDSFPRANTFWFRDWFYPLWKDHGKAAVLAKFFRLVSEHFPKQPENGARNMIYSRRMNLGEYVHFTSAAAGRNLSTLATTAFGTAFTTAQFNQARTDFPALTY